MSDVTTKGPLAGVRVVEFASIGPGPHCAMMLSDLGAEVLRIDREGGNGWPNAIVDRGRSTAAVDIRTPGGRDFCLAACDKADVVIEGFRPGVMERLGLGPDDMFARNAGLVYGRMTGWGQGGPLANEAGHDINYIAITGALHAIGTADGGSLPPLNLVGDFGGGSTFLAFGIVAALLERQTSGRGQVVDAAIVDGVSSLMTFFDGLAKKDRISLERKANFLSGAAPFYRTYRCRDDREIAVGPLEPRFYEEFLDIVGAPPGFRGDQYLASNWQERGEILAQIFVQRDRDEWVALSKGRDACMAPILTLAEAVEHPHLKARRTYVNENGLVQSAPAPRFSRTPGAVQPTGDPDALLTRWSTIQLARLKTH